MKRIKIYMIVAVASMAALSMGCDPLEDEINAINSVEVQDIEYTLTEDDYDDIDDICGCTRFGNFSSEDDAKANIPVVLTDKFPALGKGSSALVTYEFFRGNYVNNDKLDADDYADIDAAITEAYFNSSFPASNSNLAKAAANLNTDPVNGQAQIIKYAVADAAYADVDGFDLFQENFNRADDLSDFMAISVSGVQEWQVGSSSSGYQYAGMSGYSGGNNANEDWLIIPEIDLTNNSQAVLKLDHVLNFLSGGVVGVDIAVKASVNYDGTSDPATATWTNLIFDDFPAGNSYDMVRSEASLAAYAGEKVHIAFYYNSTTSYAPLWRISEIDIKTTDWEYETAVLTYSLSSDRWNVIDANDDFEYVDPSEFDEMGIRVGYFSSSTLGQGYIPVLLSRNYPYALEGDTKIVVYDYYTSSRGEIQTRGNQYTFIDGAWVAYSSTVEQQLQFGHDGETWVPDNTIKYTITSADFAIIGAEENMLGNAAARDNLRSFGNFGTQWSHAEIIDAIGFILKLNFPNSEVGQKYLVTYNTYPAGDLSSKVILDASGEYVEIAE